MYNNYKSGLQNVKKYCNVTFIFRYVTICNIVFATIFRYITKKYTFLYVKVLYFRYLKIKNDMK